MQSFEFHMSAIVVANRAINDLIRWKLK
jgi:hypothetical protein